jgi:uncharacterized protein with ParB-like and HNH nuclease domain
MAGFGVHAHVFGDLTKGPQAFRLPRNQRKYSWGTKEQATDLWNDLFEFHVEEATNYYFLGNFIICPNEGGKRSKETKGTEYPGQKYDFVSLIDGQQRLTSFILLSCAVRDVLSHLKNTELEVPERLKLISVGKFSINKDSDGRKSYSLAGKDVSDKINKLGDVENKMIQRMFNTERNISVKLLFNCKDDDLPDDIKREHWEESLQLFELSTQQENNKRLKHFITPLHLRKHLTGNITLIDQNYNLYRSKLWSVIAKKITDSKSRRPPLTLNDCGKILHEFGDKLLKNVSITITKVDDMGAAYTIFGRMNDRGMKLSNSDLLRNFFLEMASKYVSDDKKKKDALKNIEDLWEPIWKLEPELQEKLLMNFWSVYQLVHEPEIAEKDEVPSQDVSSTDSNPNLVVDDEGIVSEEEEFAAVVDDEEPEPAEEEITKPLGLPKWVGKAALNKTMQSKIIEHCKQNENFDMDILNDYVKALSDFALNYDNVNQTKPTLLSEQNYLNIFGVNIHLGLHLAMIYKGWSEEEINRVLEKVRKFQLWMKIIGDGNATTIKCLYSRWGQIVIEQEVKDVDSMLEVIHDYSKRYSLEKEKNSGSSVTKESVKSKFINWTEKSNNKIKRMLYELEKSYESAEDDVGIITDFSKIHLEHILPQAVPNGSKSDQVSNWKEAFDRNNSDSEPNQSWNHWTYQLGNCTLLNHKVNQKLKVSPFETKEAFEAALDSTTRAKDYTSKRFAIRKSNLKINSKLLEMFGSPTTETDSEIKSYVWADGELPVWTAAQVRERTERLADDLLNLWKYW